MNTEYIFSEIIFFAADERFNRERLIFFFYRSIAKYYLYTNFLTYSR